MISGRPVTVHASVIDRFGRPLDGVHVHVRNSSGGNSATTDINGYAIIHLSEREVLEVTVNGVRVMDNPGVGVEQGLAIVITLKDTNAISMEPATNRALQ